MSEFVSDGYWRQIQAQHREIEQLRQQLETQANTITELRAGYVSIDDVIYANCGKLTADDYFSIRKICCANMKG